MLQLVFYWFVGVAVFFVLMYGSIWLVRKIAKRDDENGSDNDGGETS